MAVHEPTQVLEALRNCRRLIIVDACQSGGVAGTVTRLTWPDPRIAVAHQHSTHGVGVADVLRLAEKLGDLPPMVEIFGIEAGDRSLGQDLTPAVVRAVSEVAVQIVGRVREVAHA
jgi:hydrogenase maturation protease